MLKLLFEVLTIPMGLPIDPIAEYIIMDLLGLVAFFIAWDVSPGGRFGSVIHWAARLPAYVILWAVTYAICVAVNWVVANWIVVLCILGGLVVLSGSVGTVLLVRNKRSERKQQVIYQCVE